MTAAIPEAVAQRAATRYTVSPGGCHISTYSVVPTTGYAQIGWRDSELGKVQVTGAHRAAWTHTHGPIPAGLTIDHLCREKRCVNVAHLRLLSRAENARRHSHDFPLGQCANGHPLSSYSASARRPYCRACKRDSNARARSSAVTAESLRSWYREAAAS